jgi:excisionase family DNA binding protein
MKEKLPAVPGNRGRSVPEAAEVLGISVRTAWALIADGRLRSVKVSQRRRVVTDAEISRILSGGLADHQPDAA